MRAIGSRSTRLVRGGTRGGGLTSVGAGFDGVEWTAVDDCTAGVVAGATLWSAVRAAWVSGCDVADSLVVVS